MEAGKRNITDIFNRIRQLEIPFFQRAYVWDKDNWERFLEDLLEVSRTRNHYFLGSVILKQRPTSTNEQVDGRIVIDGQQRLTTLLLLFKVLCQTQNRENFFKELVINHAGTLILRHNRLDAEIFEAILLDGLTPDLEDRYKDNQVLGAYKYFVGKKNEVATIDLLSILNGIYFVGIDLGADEDEQRIFDTINSLGVSLSTAELLKNELYSRDQVLQYERTWVKVFEADEERRSYWAKPVTSGRERRENIDLFLQAFLLMEAGPSESIRVDALFESFKDHLAGVVNRSSFIEELTKSAEIYYKNIDPDVVTSEVGPTERVNRLAIVIFALNTTTVVPYLLFVLRYAELQERDGLLELLEGYIIRRVICGETSKNYNNFFAGLIRERILQRENLQSSLLKEVDTVNRFPSDEAVASAFRSQNLTNKQALVILWLLELSVRNHAKQSTTLNAFSHYSLEHLMPKKWRNHWQAQGALTADRAAERDEALRKMGNLSLLASGLNSSIRDSDWETKKLGRGKHLGLNDYAKGIETLSTDLALGDWNEKMIVDRGGRLAKQAIATWAFPI